MPPSVEIAGADAGKKVIAYGLREEEASIRGLLLGRTTVFERILLATDETRESLVALREGALLARRFKAKVFLLVVMTHGAGARMADGVYPMPRSTDGEALLEAGLDRLRRLGLQASGAIVAGEPAQQIGAAAARFKADLVVVGHRRQNLLDRWWSGASGSYIVDNVACSVLLARNCVTDEEFERLLAPDQAHSESQSLGETTQPAH